MSANSTITGNLTRDPEITFIGDKGTPCAKFSVAVSRGYKNQQTGEWVNQDPHYFDIVAYGPLAENVVNSFHQGERVLVSGRLEQQTWDDKETGKKRSRIVLNADDVAASVRFATVAVTKREREGGNATPAPRPQQSAPQQADFGDEPF